jgi:hypothetical protein
MIGMKPKYTQMLKLYPTRENKKFPSLLTWVSIIACDKDKV